MNTNLIQNFIINRQNAGGTVNSNNNRKEPHKKPMPHFDIHHVLKNKDLIKPQDGQGHLVNYNLFNIPLYAVKDTIYDAKALKHALKGEANDHELGKLNNLGLTVGGLAIASYLFTRKQTPMTKVMEFVGLGSFLASMAIWPKIAIQLPAYLVHGFNVQKEYIDSAGRKKPFAQDPQFLPWDLCSEQKIQKIGDYMGIDKNIPNRRTVIQDEMKKKFIQNNTLWMLTAGFATPVMSGLICNQLEPHISKFLNDMKNKKADKILNNIEQYAEKYQDNKIQTRVEKILNLYSDKPFNKEFEKLILESFSQTLEPAVSKRLIKDLKAFIDLEASSYYNIDEKAAKTIYANLIQKFEEGGVQKEFISSMLPNAEVIINNLKSNSFMNKNITASDFRNVTKSIELMLEDMVEEYNKSAMPDKKEDFVYINSLLNNNKNGEHPVKKIKPVVQTNKITPKVVEKVRLIAEFMDDFRAKMYALDEAAVLKIGSAPETVIANYWNNTSKDILKLFGITPKQFEKVRFNKSLFADLLRDRIEKIASDDKLYNKVMKGLIEKVAVINKEIKPDIMSEKLFQKEFPDKRGPKPLLKPLYDKKVDIVFEDTAALLHVNGLTRTANLLSGKGSGDDISVRNLQKAFVSDRLLGVKSSFYRLINTLDFYRRIADTPASIDSIDVRGSLSKEIKEELVELCKIITLEGHSSDHATKFYMQRNQHPAADNSSIEVKNGKVINKYLGATEDVADIGGDKYFYQNAMRAMFESPMHHDTQKLAEASPIYKELVNYRDMSMEILGSDKYFAKLRHLVRDPREFGSNLKFLITGISTDEFFYKGFQQVYNTHKWKNMFGKFALGLLGVTVLAQFVFRKMTNPQIKGNKNDKSN